MGRVGSTSTPGTIINYCNEFSFRIVAFRGPRRVVLRCIPHPLMAKRD